MKSKFVTFIAAAAVSAACAAADTPATPNDAQIAAIVVAANSVDIDAGKLAGKMASNPEVKKFAALMVADHTGVNQKALALVKKLKVVPQESDTSKSLKAGGADNIASLSKLKGAQFDKAYVDHEVTYHENVIDALDKTLIPHASNAELKETLVKVRPAFVAHLEHARHIQMSLK